MQYKHGARYDGALRNQITADLRQDGSMLLPLRLFIGIGWLRASTEKLVDHGWWHGQTLDAFLRRQLADDAVSVPAYRSLIEHQFLHSTELLAWTILLGQMLVGLAILTGTLTNAALLAGLFMNLNFVLAGEPTPSAFYLVIQLALLVMNAGAIVGIDAALCKRVRQPALTARAESIFPNQRVSVPTLLLIAVVACLMAIYMVALVRDFSPGGSVHDPAMILTITSLMVSGWAAISIAKQRLVASVDEQSPVAEQVARSFALGRGQGGGIQEPA